MYEIFSLGPIRTGWTMDREKAIACNNKCSSFLSLFFGTCICKKTSLNAVWQSDTSVILLIPV